MPIAASKRSHTEIWPTKTKKSVLNIEISLERFAKTLFEVIEKSQNIVQLLRMSFFEHVCVKEL